MFVSESTKDEERKALAKIRDIIESVGGTNSYIGAAIDYSVLNLASDNIDNDFMATSLSRIESAQEEAAAAKQDAANVRTMMERLQDEIRQSESEKKTLFTTCDNWERLHAEQERHINEIQKAAEQERAARIDAEKKLTAANNEIQRLKAMLFDYMTKGEKEQ